MYSNLYHFKSVFYVLNNAIIYGLSAFNTSAAVRDLGKAQRGGHKMKDLPILRSPFRNLTEFLTLSLSLKHGDQLLLVLFVKIC
jgi:hypothetical protein